MNQKQFLALSCLLAEQISPQERLLWRSCPELRRSSAVRAERLLPKKRPYVIALGSLVGGGLLAGLSLSISAAQGTAADQALNSASGWLLAALIVGVILYVVSSPAGISRPRWWHLLMGSPLGKHVPLAMHQEDPSLIEPPPVPALRGKEIYGLTDRRVIILAVGKRRSVRSFWLRDLEGIQSVDAGDGWGDLVLSSRTSDRPPCAGHPVKRELVRLFGIECVCRLEAALRSLLTHKPLKVAMDALAPQPDTFDEARLSLGDMSSALSARDRQWQAVLWHGHAMDGLESTIVYGADLQQLRTRAAAWLMQNRPRYFCNTSYPPANEHLALRGQYGLYSCSEPPSRQSSGSLSMLAEIPPDCQSLDEPSSGQRRRFKSKRIKAEDGVDEGLLLQNQRHAAPEPNPELHAQKVKEPQLCRWMRESLAEGRHVPRIFSRFEDAVAHFVCNDVLPERGPAFIDELLLRKSQLRHVQTVKVVDDEIATNDLLHRGGWHIFHVMGMTAPRGQVGPVLFVLGHPEDQAV